MPKPNLCLSTHRMFLSLLVALIMVGCSGLPQMERPNQFAVGDTIAAGQVMDNDVLLSGSEVVIDGDVNGDVIAVGNTVRVNGNVSGSVFVFSLGTSINGDVEGSVYAFGQSLELGSNSHIANNAHFVGLSLDTLSGSKINRDLAAVSLRASLNTEIGRSLRGFILLMTLNGTIGGGTETEEPEGETEGDSTSASRERVSVSIGRPFISFSLKDGFGKTTTISTHKNAINEDYGQQQESLQEVMPEWLLDRLTELVILLLIGGLMVWLIPTFIRHPAEALRQKPLPATGFGLLAGIIAANGALIVIVLAILLLMFGLWVGAAVQWNLAFLFWGIVYPSLLFASSLFTLMVAYGSKVVVGDLVGTLILEKVSPNSIRYRLLPFIIGVVLYVLLRAIPYAGIALEVIVTILGLGGIWIAYRHWRKQRRSQKSIIEKEVETTEKELTDENSA